MNIFLDDEREVKWIYPNDPHRWTLVRTYAEFVALVNQNLNNITCISLDHDLGMAKGNWSDDLRRHYTGYDAIRVVEELIYSDKITARPLLFTHSANPSGRARIQQAIDSIERYWDECDDV